MKCYFQCHHAGLLITPAIPTRFQDSRDFPQLLFAQCGKLCLVSKLSLNSSSTSLLYQYKDSCFGTQQNSSDSFYISLNFYYFLLIFLYCYIIKVKTPYMPAIVQDTICSKEIRICGHDRVNIYTED